MFTNTQSKLMVQDKATVLKPNTSPRVQELMTLGRQEAWDFAVLGQAPHAGETNTPGRLANCPCSPRQ